MLPMLLLFCDLNTYRKYYLNRNYALILQGLGFFFFFFNLGFFVLLFEKDFFPDVFFWADTYEIP